MKFNRSEFMKLQHRLHPERYNGMSGKNHSNLTKLKISKSRKGTMTGNSNSFYGKKHSDSSKLKISISRKGIPCWNKGLKTKESTKQKIRNARLKQIIPFKDSKPERIVQLNLRIFGVDFIKHYPIIGQPDIFIKPNLCIFVDGSYWHTVPNQIMRDNSVNIILQMNGYRVIRIWEHDILSNPIKSILRVLNESNIHC